MGIRIKSILLRHGLSFMAAKMLCMHGYNATLHGTYAIRDMQYENDAVALYRNRANVGTG